MLTGGTDNDGIYGNPLTREERRGFDATLTKKRPLYDNLEQQCLFDRFDQSFAFKSFAMEGRVSFEQMLLSRWRNNQ